MKQRTIWKVFLIIGISFLLFSCKQEADYRLDVDIIYKNETNHVVSYYKFYSEPQNKELIFELQPNSEKKFEIRGESGRDIDIDNLGVLGNVQEYLYHIFISYDNSDKCLIYKYGEGSTVEANYNTKEISTRYYETVYTFTEEEYNKAVKCE